MKLLGKWSHLRTLTQTYRFPGKLSLFVSSPRPPAKKYTNVVLSGRHRQGAVHGAGCLGAAGAGLGPGGGGDPGDLAESPGGGARQTEWAGGRGRGPRHGEPGQVGALGPCGGAGRACGRHPLSERMATEPASTGPLLTRVATGTGDAGLAPSGTWAPHSRSGSPVPASPWPGRVCAGLGALRFQGDRLLGLTCVPLIHMRKPSPCVAVFGDRAARMETEVRCGSWRVALVRRDWRPRERRRGGSEAGGRPREGRLSTGQGEASGPPAPCTGQGRRGWLVVSPSVRFHGSRPRRDPSVAYGAGPVA